MLLAIDVGNTNLVLGVYSGQRLLHNWRLSTNRSATADEYGVTIYHLFQHAKLEIADVEGVIISSVVPPLNPMLDELCARYLHMEPLIVGPGLKTGMNIRYENPREVGADRIVNAVAAIELYGPPLILVDFGTATTYDYVDEQGQYIGGAIAPGIGISTEALYQKAAKLPRIELSRPNDTVGRNMIHSMQSGIIFGYVGQVDGIVKRICKEVGQRPRVIATGGLAGLIAADSETISEVNPLLTLTGLRILYERNVKHGGRA